MLAVLTASGLAQRQDRKMDPEIVNYKLSMDKIKAFDGALHKITTAAKADPTLQTAMKGYGDKKTLAEMTSAVESNPKMMAVIKSSGLTAKEFCLVPMGIMAAGGAYMIQTQYKKDVSGLATAENVAFYGAHKDEIEKITNSWSHEE